LAIYDPPVLSTLTNQSDPRDTVRHGRDRTQPEVRSRAEPYGGGTRRGPTMASPVMLPDHGDTNGWSRVRTQPEAGPKEVQEPEPN